MKVKIFFYLALPYAMVACQLSEQKTSLNRLFCRKHNISPSFSIRRVVNSSPILPSVLQHEQYDINKAIKKYVELGLSMPTAEEDGRIQTLNKKGATSPYLDEATIAFIESAKRKKVLEVGGGYGNVMEKTLQTHPDTIYHFNDLERRHCFIAANEIKKSGKIKDETLKNIRFITADIASPLHIDKDYEAVLVARVLHFLSPPQMEVALSNLFNMLRAGGRVYTVAITPYVKRFESFIPEYRKRLLAGEEYPGYVKSLKDWVNKDATTTSQLASISEDPFMFLDDKVLSNLFKKAGFKIVECKLTSLGYASPSWALDGKENVILIAEKPFLSKL